MKSIRATETKSERFPRMVNRETAMNAVMAALCHGKYAAIECYEVDDDRYIVSYGDAPSIEIDEDTARLIKDAYNEAERRLLFYPNDVCVRLC